MNVLHSIYLTSPFDIHKNVVVASGSATIAFTDGDTFKRATITDANVFTTSKIIGTIRRPDVASEVEDDGFVYHHNIVLLENGSFDISVTCTAWGFEDPFDDPPNETIRFNYFVLNTV